MAEVHKQCTDSLPPTTSRTMLGVDDELHAVAGTGRAWALRTWSERRWEDADISTLDSLRACRRLACSLCHCAPALSYLSYGLPVYPSLAVLAVWIPDAHEHGFTTNGRYAPGDDAQPTAANTTTCKLLLGHDYDLE